MSRLTPAMRQYMSIKERFPDCLVLFRMGDFYETFYDDAKKAAEALEITLTKRGAGSGAKIPLAGIPYHALDSYLSKLVKKGIKTVIVEQTEDPKLAKGVVRRDVVRIVTPGTVTEPHMLDEKSNNYIASVYHDGLYGISAVDISTGEFVTTETADLQDEISRLSPAEILLPVSMEDSSLAKKLRDRGYFINSYDDRHFLHSRAYSLLSGHFKVHSLDGLGLEHKKLAVSSAGALLGYLMETQKTSLGHIGKVRVYTISESMQVDGITARDLELVRNIRDGSVKDTLFDVLNHTRTAMGSRMLKKWILAPLKSMKKIVQRLDSVEEIYSSTIMRQELTELLHKIGDIERLMSRISLGSANARDLVAMKNSLMLVPEIRDALSKSGSYLLSEVMHADDMAGIVQLLQKSIKEEPPMLTREGNMIKRGYNTELDEQHDIKANGRAYIRSLEEKERRATGIKNLKIGFNRVFGYYFEVTKKNMNLVPEHYIRKQTMANCERFVTEELKQWEEKILGAEEKINQLEYGLFQEITGKVAEKTKEIQNTAKKIAVLDCLNSLAIAAVFNKYTRPDVREGFSIKLEGSRHPVLERAEEGFIPNDIELSKDKRLIILTGPNMAGKSTVMRQAALAVLMAQAGSFVPAESAEIGMVDRIFTRVGAHDDIMHGQSTFMVEMNEVASILNNATRQSFIIMDEIGRGTSTFDGVSIAWSVAEYIIHNLGCKTMFATHYHVLTKLSKYSGVKNYNIAVREDKDDIIFLRKLVSGGTDKSYGVHVARLAGMPSEVIEKAREIQFRLEEEDSMRDRIVVDKKQDDSHILYTKSKQKTLLEL